VMLVMLAYLLMLRKPLHDRGALTEADHAVEQRSSLWVALSPWLILTPSPSW